MTTEEKNGRRSSDGQPVACPHLHERVVESDAGGFLACWCRDCGAFCGGGANWEYPAQRSEAPRPTQAEPSDPFGAIRRAGFRISNDLLDVPTLWCIECGRDSGFHWAECSKGIGAPRTEAKRVEVVEALGRRPADARPTCESCETRPASKWCNGCIIEDHQAAEIRRRESPRNEGLPAEMATAAVRGSYPHRSTKEGGTTMRATGEKPDPVGPLGMAGERSDEQEEDAGALRGAEPSNIVGSDASRPGSARNAGVDAKDALEAYRQAPDFAVQDVREKLLEVVRWKRVIDAARAWREVARTCRGIDAAESALVAAVDALAAPVSSDGGRK